MAEPRRLPSGIIPRRGKLSSFGRPPDIEYQAAAGAPLTPQRRAPRPIRIDPETVPDAPSYWPYRSPGVWAERAQKIARGVGSFGPSGLVKSLLTGDMGRRITRGAEATGDVPPGAPWYSRPAVGFEAIYKPELEALTAVGETTAPARGAAAIWGPYGFVEEEVRQRYDIHRARGLDPVSAMAAAYNQAEASPGEISGIKKFGLHALTDPAELLPGGILASLGRRAATSAARAAVKTAAEAIEQAGKRGPMGRKLPEALPPAARGDWAVEPGDSVFHGTRGGRIESFIDTDGNLVLQPSTNFEGRQVGVSFTGDRATAVDYATRFSAGEAGGAIAARRQRGGNVFEIDIDAIPNKLFPEAADELATRSANPVVIPKGRFKVSSVDEEAQAALRAFETEGRASARALSNRELGERDLSSIIEGEVAEHTAGGEYSGWFPYEGRSLTKAQLDIADRFGFEAVDNPLGPFIGPEIARRMAGKSPDELTALFKGLAKGADDLSPADRNAPFFYGPDFETHFRKTFGDDIAVPTPSQIPSPRTGGVPSTTPAARAAVPSGLMPRGVLTDQEFQKLENLYKARDAIGEVDDAAYLKAAIGKLKSSTLKGPATKEDISEAIKDVSESWSRTSYLHPEVRLGSEEAENIIGDIYNKLAWKRYNRSKSSVEQERLADQLSILEVPNNHPLAEQTRAIFQDIIEETPGTERISVSYRQSQNAVDAYETELIRKYGEGEYFEALNARAAADVPVTPAARAADVPAPARVARVSHSTRTIEQLEEMSDKELIQEAISTRKDHISGLGMEQTEFSGIYLNTEAANRYLLSARPKSKLHSADVTITNPRIFRSSFEYSEYQNDFLPNTLPSGTGHTVNLRLKDGTINYDELAILDQAADLEGKVGPTIKAGQEATAQLKREGYDSVYLPEADFNEGILVVFDEKNVRLSSGQEITKELLESETQAARRSYAIELETSAREVLSAPAARAAEEAPRSFPFPTELR